ncbi:hypothetical protein ACIFQM_15470 [Paenibacillus sp. NRS-1782]|uniref:hypothetical protein n=1 Tax=unclassified Paenibacillus TaxID=185978 RepID=UPI003D26F6E6
MTHTNIEDSLRFYVNTMGVEVQGKFDTGLFVSTGGYHHHIGGNVGMEKVTPILPLMRQGLRKLYCCFLTLDLCGS